MGTIDDVRKVIQDLVAPELKSLHVELQRVDETSKLRDDALSAKIDTLSDKMDAKIDKVDVKIDTLSDKMDLKIDTLSDKMDLKFNALSDKMDVKFDGLSDKMDLRFELILAKMESNHAAMLYTASIDKRLEAIEKKSAEPMQAT